MENIIIAIDFSPYSERVLSVGITTAKAFGADAFLIHVASPDPDFVGNEVGPQSVRATLAEQFRTEHTQLADWSDRFREDGVKATPLLIQGQTVAKLLQESERLGSGMIISGSHGHSVIHSLVLGSTSEGLTRKSKCPVMIVPCRPEESVRDQ